MKRLWVAVIVICLFVLWARYPADAFGCAKVHGFIQTYGARTVFDRAIQMGYTRAQIFGFRRSCRQQGVRF